MSAFQLQLAVVLDSSGFIVELYLSVCSALPFGSLVDEFLLGSAFSHGSIKALLALCLSLP